MNEPRAMVHTPPLRGQGIGNTGTADEGRAQRWRCHRVREGPSRRAGRPPAPPGGRPAPAPVLDFGEPVAVMLLGILGHAAATAEQMYTITRRLMAAVAAGSYLAVSDGVDIGHQGHRQAAVLHGYHLRIPAEFDACFTGLRLVEPGLMPVNSWRPDLAEIGHSGPLVNSPPRTRAQAGDALGAVVNGQPGFDVCSPRLLMTAICRLATLIDGGSQARCPKLSRPVGDWRPTGTVTDPPPIGGG